MKKTLLAAAGAAVAGAYVTVLASVFFPVLVFFRAGRPVAVAAMLAFHLAIAVLMGLTSFALVMAAFDLLFVNAHVVSLRRRARSLWDSAAARLSAPAHEDGHRAEAVDRSGRWRASLRGAGDWRVVREPRGPYASASLVEWGSITKGLVGTTAWLTLEVERPVVHYLLDVPDAVMTVADFVHHTSGLPRLPATMRDSLFGDPYRKSVGARLDLAAAMPVAPPGRFVYSNPGYTLLGAVLDVVHGDWFAAVRQQVLEPAGIRSASLTPPTSDCVVPRLFGRPIKPWALGASAFAWAGGVWSTFDDLCRYADWALDVDAEPARTVSWRREAASTWINGEVRAAGAVIANAAGMTAVVHTLAKAPHAADKIATALIEQELRR